MKRSLIASLIACMAIAFATTAAAQVFQWKDANGKTIFSDKPPPSDAKQKRTIVPNAVKASATSPQKTLAEKDLEFRKRQKETQEQSAKHEEEQKTLAEKKERCDNMRRHAQALDSGVRIARTNDKGERYFLSDDQRQEELAKTRQSMESGCQ